MKVDGLLFSNNNLYDGPVERTAEAQLAELAPQLPALFVTSPRTAKGFIDLVFDYDHQSTFSR
jgi:hypothetical protein